MQYLPTFCFLEGVGDEISEWDRGRRNRLPSSTITMLIGKSVIRSGKENMSILLMCSLLVIPHISENMKAKYPNPDHFSKYERYQGFNLMLQIEVTSACNSTYRNILSLVSLVTTVVD